jgi:DNA N-6-adenine-methyltransferase (Dam)
VSRADVSGRGQRGRGMGGHSVPGGGLSNEWYTPPGIFDALSIDFDLDPAHPSDRLPWIPAERTFCKADDGLSQPWHGRVWLNPPYGRETDPWLERFVEHGNGIALVFARTETDWFHRHALGVDAWCLIRGRLTFVHADGQPARFNAGAPSLLLACGPECVDALIRSKLGITVGVNESVEHAQASIFHLHPEDQEEGAAA